MQKQALQPACDSCGNRKYGLIDGFYYCTVCNAQSQQLVEYEAEADTVINVTRLARKSEKKKKVEPSSVPKINKKFIENGRNMVPIRHWTMNNEDFPRYLRQTGRRLTTFARLLVQFCNRLHHNFGVPNSVFRIANYLLQRHFAHLGIAFCDDEVVKEDEDGHSYNERLLNAEYRLKEREIKRQKQAFIDKRRADQSARNFDDVWGFLNQTQEEAAEIEETILAEANESISQAMETLRRIESKPTKLSGKAVVQAGLTYLEVDAIVTLAFAAAQLAGAQWITLWDLFRWYREGRFGVTTAQLHALGMDIDQRNKTLAMFACHRERHLVTGSIPLCNAYRILTYFAYTTNIPASLSYPPLPALIDRFLGILNLPYVFRFRCLALADLVTEPDLRLGSSLCHAYPIQEGFAEKLSGLKHLGTTNYFSHVFVDDYQKYAGQQGNPDQIFLGAEIKVAAIILMALKLTFGLDGEREYKIPHGIDDPVTFVFHDWLIQLRLRLKVWEGGSVEEVLSETSLDIDDFLMPTHNFRRRHVPHELYHGYNAFNRNYKGVVPLRASNANADKLFYDLMRPKHVPSEPLVSDYSTRALYSPLETQAILGMDAMDEEAGQGISQTKKDVFAADFAQKIIPVPAEFDEHADTTTKDFLKLFPCADKYHRIPLPPTNSNILTPTGRPAAYRKHMDDLYRSTQRFLSSEFQRLLKTFGMIFGEDPSVLFYAFILVENYYFMRDEADVIEEYLRSGDGLANNVEEKVTADEEVDEVCKKWAGQPRDVKGNIHLVEPTIETKREFVYQIARDDLDTTKKRRRRKEDTFIVDDGSDVDESMSDVYSDEASYDGEGMDVDDDEATDEDGGGDATDAMEVDGDREKVPPEESEAGEAVTSAVPTQGEVEAAVTEESPNETSAPSPQPESQREEPEASDEESVGPVKRKRNDYRNYHTKNAVSTDLCLLFLHWRYW